MNVVAPEFLQTLGGGECFQKIWLSFNNNPHTIVDAYLERLPKRSH